MSAQNEFYDTLHPYVTQLLYVAAHDSVTLEAIGREFELDEPDPDDTELDVDELEDTELNKFVSWAKLHGFASVGDGADGISTLQITPEGTKWVLGQLWDFSSGEYSGEV